MTRTLPIALLMTCLAAGPTPAEICEEFGASPFYRNLTICTNSELPPVGRYDYKIANLFDFDPATAWCEGLPGDGIGATVTLHLDRPQPFGQLLIDNGYGKSAKVWAQNARIRRLGIRTDQGDAFQVELRDSRDEQTVALPRRAPWRWIELTILSVWPGTKYRDACLDLVAPDMLETQGPGR